jgi:hypothetical protein
VTSARAVGTSLMVVLALNAHQSVNAQYASSTFDTGLDGWTSDAPQITWEASGGNPDGYVRFSDEGAGGTHVLAPQKFLGDWSSLDGMESISFDHRLFDVGSGTVGFLPYDVGISGPGGEATWEGPTPSGPTDWLSVIVPLTQDEWSITSGAWEALLSNVTEFRIRIEVVNNAAGHPSGEIDGIDNVVLTPEPATFSLLVLGVLLTATRRR